MSGRHIVSARLGFGRVILYLRKILFIVWAADVTTLNPKSKYPPLTYPSGYDTITIYTYFGRRRALHQAAKTR